jgi:hypothetical protein
VLRGWTEMWSKRAPYTLGDLALRGFCVTAARLRPLLVAGCGVAVS